MVLGTQSTYDTEVNLLPPALPAYLLQRRGPYTFKPRASADSRIESPASTSQPTNNTSGSLNDVGSTSNSLRSSTPIISLPRGPGSGLVGFGLGSIVFGGPRAAKAISLWPFFGRKATVSKSSSKNILIMMSNTGGGHKASAEAIQSAFVELYGDEYKIHIIDMWKDHTPSPFNNFGDSYTFLVKHSWLWRAAYEVTNPRAFHIPYLAGVGMIISQGLAEAYDKYQPDLVVSVHPLMQHVPIRVLKKRIAAGLQKPTNFATVVTDFTTCHNTWFCPGATRCFVPTDFCKKLGKRMGLKEQQLITHGLPIRPIFSKPLPERKQLRRTLGMDPTLPAVLLVGGGEGFGKLEATVDELDAKLGGSCQAVVICGRNKPLLERLRAHPQGPGRIKVVACGFVNNIHEYMAASDIIVTKAGPGTIAEALISGLPILLNGNIPCQEEGNIPYVIDNQVGAFEKKPSEIAKIIKSWLSEGSNELAAMAARAKALGRPEAVYQIARDLAGLADAPDYKYGPSTAAASKVLVGAPA